MRNNRIDRFFVSALFSLPMIFFSKVAFEIYFGEKDLIFALTMFSYVLCYVAPYLLIDYVNQKMKRNGVYAKLGILILTNIMIIIFNKPYNMKFSGNIDIINVILLILFYIVNVIYLVYYFTSVLRLLIDKGK